MLQNPFMLILALELFRTILIVLIAGSSLEMFYENWTKRAQIFL